jgi:adenylate cyclase
MARTETSYLIGFVDLLRFTAQSARSTDREIAEVIDEYYQRVSDRLEPAGGRIVKFIGDGALVVFAEADADRGVAAVLDLKPEIDAWMAARGWECRLAARVHWGPVIAGDYGPAGGKRFDVIGRAVNQTARMELRGVSLSVDAFRKLGPELRKRFKKHTPPVSYIRVEDGHR